MRLIAVVEADFERSPLGTRSRLNADLQGETVIRRTIRRLQQAKRLDSIHVVVDVAQEAICRDACKGLDVKVETHSAGGTPWRAYVTAARKFALDGWRGGIGDATVFDESTHVWVLEALAKREQADGVAVVPAAAALIDPVLLDDMIAHFDEVRKDMRMTFTQTAPGLSAAIFAADLLHDMAEINQPPGRLIAYSPADPRPDLLTKPCFYPVPDAIAHASGRCLADTQSGMQRLDRLIAMGNGGGAPHVADASRWLMQQRFESAPLPVEIEIELTTQDPLSNTTLRPRGEVVGARGPMPFELFDKLVSELSGTDDIRIILGGFGDPLLHPDWSRFVARCRDADIFAIAVCTPGVHLDDRAIGVLLDNKVDVLHLLIDALKPDTYRALHNADHFEQVIASVDRLMAGHRERVQPEPLIVAEMAKTMRTLDELEPFFDHWLSKTGAAVLTGPSHYAGQWPDNAVMSMAPPTRSPCLRVFKRAMVLADGRVTFCDQDFKGAHAVGSLAEHSLSELWNSERMTLLRTSHIQSKWNSAPLCHACDEWHRP